jgi:hypothetical protein
MGIILPYGLEYQMKQNDSFAEKLFKGIANLDDLAKTSKDSYKQKVIDDIKQIQTVMASQYGNLSYSAKFFSNDISGVKLIDRNSEIIMKAIAKKPTALFLPCCTTVLCGKYSLSINHNIIN